jgi:hypothetical protein
MERTQRSAYGGTHRLEIRNRSRSAPHATDLHNPVCRDSGSPTIHQHLAPLPQCRDGTKGNSCQPFVVVLNSLFPAKIVIDPSAGGAWEMHRGQRRADRTGESASATYVTRRSHRGSVVGRLLDTPDKKIARSVLFLSPVLATRQLPANDSDTSGMS